MAQRQSPVSGHTVHGEVYDSIGRQPLAGALVHLGTRDAAGVPSQVRTDVNGRFLFSGVPAGHYVLGFYHESLDALGLDAPLRAVEVGKDSPIRADIGIPPASVVRALRCGERGRDSLDNGLAAGLVRTGAGRQPVSGATVMITWNELSTGTGILRSVPGRASITAGEDGTFSMCGVPLATTLEFDVRAAGYRVLSGPVSVPDAGVLRQDAFLVDTAAHSGTAELRGRVVHEDDRPVVSGRAVIPALSRDAPIVDGAFLVGGLPPGSWVMQIRTIGSNPRSVVVRASQSRNSSLLMRMDARSQRLDAVTIFGRPDRTIRILDEVLQRQRTAFGTVFLPGSTKLRDAFYITDVLEAARGFSVRGTTDITGRAVTTGARCSRIGVYVNGTRLVDGIESLNGHARPGEVLALEAYPDVASAPFQWRTMDGTCAVVALWTRR